MDRRKFLTPAVVSMVGAAASQLNFAAALETVSSGPEVHVTIDPVQTLAVIPPDFMGLGYEISSAARPALLSAQNAVYVQLIQTLGKNGVIRVGGNTSDYATYQATGQPLSSPEGKAGSVVNDAVLRDLGTFLDATGWKLIWGLNLGNSILENAVLEARAVTAATEENLLAFEIGNEPDLFTSHPPRHEGHRPPVMVTTTTFASIASITKLSGRPSRTLLSPGLTRRTRLTGSYGSPLKKARILSC